MRATSKTVVYPSRLRKTGQDDRFTCVLHDIEDSSRPQKDVITALYIQDDGKVIFQVIRWPRLSFYYFYTMPCRLSRTNVSQETVPRLMAPPPNRKKNYQGLELMAWTPPSNDSHQSVAQIVIFHSLRLIRDIFLAGYQGILTESQCQSCLSLGENWLKSINITGEAKKKSALQSGTIFSKENSAQRNSVPAGTSIVCAPSSTALGVLPAQADLN
ncbi:hypothetical protein ACRALDRAFT_2022612 [Sodiomyces alcalophilus JCM 7366]|uniref:uncharacterized protein n=1 Tax=Sodiomyces alcalophilus JCM 7366 TaxID=591952 RepID=UPI0039B4FEB0